MTFFESINFTCQNCGFNYHINDSTCDFTCSCGNKIIIKYVDIPNKKRKKPPTTVLQCVGCDITRDILF